MYNENTISRNIREMGILRGKKVFITTQIENCIVNDFKTKNLYCKELSEKYKIKVHTIYRILDKYKIQRKTGKHSSCNEDYFSKIDSPNKAYLLGFITADGSITGKYSNSCSIEVQMKDSDILYFAKSEINPSSVITECFYKKKMNQKVRFSSKKLCNDLKKYGVIPNKSLIIKRVPVELIPTELLCYYFRGLIDGDGCVHKDGKISIYSGSKDFIESVQETLCQTIKVKKIKNLSGNILLFNVEF